MIKIKSQKIISLTLILAMLMSMFTFSGFTVGANEGQDAISIWSGEAKIPVDSDGDGIYEITSGEELAYVVFSGGGADKSYKLTGDIYLNDINKIDWTTGEAIGDYTPNSWYANHTVTAGFQGTIDGDGYTVYGLYLEGNPSSYTVWKEGTGLIPLLAEDSVTEIKNLGVDYTYLHYQTSASAFVGVAPADASLSIDCCYVGENVTLKAATAAAFRAYAGSAAGTNITNCYSLATTIGTGHTGLIGHAWNEKVVIKNSYNAKGLIISDPWQYAVDQGIDDVYATDNGAYVDSVVARSVENMKGLDVFSNTDKMPLLNGTGKFVATEGYPVLKAFVKGQSGDDGSETPSIQIWNGEETAPEGDGTEQSPYLITNGAELAYIIKTGGGANKYYKLTNDIYLNDVNKIDWATGNAIGDYTPNSWYPYNKVTGFQGTIDGNGYIVYGLYLEGNPSSYIAYHEGTGLIPILAENSSTTVKNLGVDYTYLHYETTASAFVAVAPSGAYLTMDSCYAGENVTLKAATAATLRGYANNAIGANITNCYSLATLNGSRYTGLVGLTWDGANNVKISNCYNANGIITNQEDSYYEIDSANNYESIGGSLTEGTNIVSADNMKGLDVFTNSGKMPLLNAAEMFVATEGYPVLKAFAKDQIGGGDDNEEEEEIVPVQIWDGNVAETLTGDGTADSPYLISNGAELAYVIKTGGGANKYYKLTNDIYLNDVNKINWTTGQAIGDYAPNSWYANHTVTAGFQGTIDGDGHTVYGLYLEGNPSSYTVWKEGTGLIPLLAEDSVTEIKNLGVDYTYLHYETSVSAFVGVAPTGASISIDCCYVGENVTLKAATAAAFRAYAGSAAGTNITNSYSLATTIGTGHTGLIGHAWNEKVVIKNSYNAKGLIISDPWQYAVDQGLENVYATNAGNYVDKVAELSADNMKGLDVFENTEKMPLLNSTGKYVATEGYPILNVFVKSQEDDNENEGEDTPSVQIWDGSVAETLTGQGTAASPYVISNGAELAFVIKTGGGANKYYKLTNDIYLNDINKMDWTTGEAIGDYTPNSWYANHTVTAGFQGTIDGNGYIVYGLYLEGNPSSYTVWEEGTGLIPKLAENSNTTIKNLGVDYAYLHYETSASAFVAVAPTGASISIDCCYVGENVTLKAATAAAFRAYAGSAAGTNITNSYSLATTIGTGHTGLIGHAWNEKVVIKNSYNAKGLIISDPWQDAVDQGLENVYATNAGNYVDKVAELSAANMQGKDVLANVLKMPYLNADGKYVATDKYPILKAFAKSQSGGDEEQVQERVPVQIWDGDVAETLSGDGTADSPYLISNGAELAYVVKTGGGANKYYKLTNDIYLNDVNKIDWATGNAIGDYTPNSWYANHTVTAGFQGTIDGNGYIVYGLYLEGNPSSYVAYHEGTGLIPILAENSSTTIKNLGVDYTYLHYQTTASAFVAVAPSGAYLTMDSCYAGENVTLKAATAATLRGYARNAIGANITNCYSLATLNGNKYTGLVGFTWDGANNVKISNCYNANGIITNQEDSYYEIDSANNYESIGGSLTEGTNIVSADNMKGLDVFTSSDKMATIGAEKFVPVVDSVPALKCFFKRTLVKDGVNYIGYSYDEFSDYYTTEDLSKYFWRYDHISANYDYEMDICDLVFMTLKFNAGENSADIDKDTVTTVKDITILRKALIGDYDYIVRPQHYTPYTSLNGNYTYVWGDEFSGDYLDASKWGVYSKLDANPEKGYFNDKDENVIDVVDGNLKLTAYKAVDGTYHSPTSVVTQNTMNFKYGYVEIRAKLPLQPGVWSSFWTKSVADKTDVASVVTSDNATVGEVDVFEIFDTNRACGNIVKWSENGSWYPSHKNYAQDVVPSEGYHIYGYEWTPTEIKYYYDGVMYARFDITESWVNKGELGKGKEGWTYKNNDETGTDMSCYQDPQYIIFNNHLFYEGVSGANDYIYTQNPNFTSADYLIDYCRVYQLKGQEEIYTK